MLFTSETAREARSRKGGLARSRYWEKLDFSNLVLAREVRAENIRLRREWGFISPEWARVLIARGIYIGGKYAELSRRAPLRGPADGSEE